MIDILSITLLIEDHDDRVFMEQLYLDHAALMYAVALSRLRNPQDAEDAVHEAVLRLIGKISLLRQKDSCTIRRYIVITVDRVSINLAIKRGRHPSTATDQAFLESIEDTDASVEDAALTRLKHEKVKQLLRMLPQRERDLLRWKYYENRSDEEIAQALGIAKNSVRKYLTHARRQLRALLEGEESE